MPSARGCNGFLRSLSVHHETCLRPIPHRRSRVNLGTCFERPKGTTSGIIPDARATIKWGIRARYQHWKVFHPTDFHSLRLYECHFEAAMSSALPVPAGLLIPCTFLHASVPVHCNYRPRARMFLCAQWARCDSVSGDQSGSAL